MDFIIRDFQSIQEVKLRVKGFTLVLGESSSGKSACLRAMYAATHNRFRNGQVRHGEDHATIMVRTDDSTEVFTAVRPWSGSIKMKLGNETFDKIGRTLPKQINEFLNFGTLDVAGDNYSLHFHDQFQKPLLLEYSQKKVMDVLSASQGIDDLMLVKDKLSEVRSENKGAFKVVDGILSSVNSELSDIKNKLDSRNELMGTLTELFADEESLSNKIKIVQELLECVDELNSITLNKNHCECKITNLQSLIDLSIRKGRVSELLDQIVLRAKVCNVLQFYSMIKTDRNLFKDILNTRQLINLVEELGINKGKKDLLTRKLELVTKVVDLDNQIKRLPFSSVLELQVYMSSHDVYSKRIAELSNIIDNKICPICHSKIN